MKESEVFNWWLPPEPWEKKPRRSRWKMTREEAAKLGATDPVDGTKEVLQLPETPEELSRNVTSAWQKNGS